MAAHNELGKEGEDEAVRYLETKVTASATAIGVQAEKNWTSWQNIKAS